MLPEITRITAGLRSEHAAATPLLDTVEFRGRGVEKVRRTYRDGAQYLIVRDAQSTPAEWTGFVPITEVGVAILERALIEEFVEKSPPHRVVGPSTGLGYIVWIAYLADGVRMVESGSGAYNALPPFVKRLDDVITQNVRRAP